MSAVPAIGALIAGPIEHVDLRLVHFAELVLVLVPFFHRALLIAIVGGENVGAPASDAVVLVGRYLGPSHASGRLVLTSC